MLLKLSRYNNWANALLLDSLANHQASNGTIGIPDYCISLLSHIANAQVIWISRINGTRPEVTVWQLHDLETCKTMLTDSGRQLEEATKNTPGLNQIVVYKTFNGASFETATEDILMHVFNHGTYHRAQIAKELKRNGIDPVNTDYIQFMRM